MNRKACWSILASVFLLGLTNCSSSNQKPGPVVTISATGGSGQNAAIGAAFTNPLVAKATTDGSPTANVSVTFTAPASGASGTFASNGTATETDITDASGLATSSAFTANSSAGAYAVVASAAGVSSSANFSLTNTAPLTVTNYSFYMSGEELINAGINILDLAGAVTIDSNGNVVGGEQDYNDAFGVTTTDPITGGTLAVDPTTGQGTLTLTTNNTSVGVNGQEEFGVQFVNTNHALIMQFDGTATSSGSMDVQDFSSAPSGNYSFTMTGVDPSYFPVGIGGVFSISGTALSNGVADANDAGTVSLGTPFTATLSAADSFGRGTVTGAFSFGASNVALVYYIVGPETIRLIAMDADDSLIGSAYSQGAGSFTNASLGSSVLVLQANPYQSEYGALGQLSTSNTASDPADFAGVGEADELDNGFITNLAAPFSGTYSVGIGAVDGYGSLTIAGGWGGGGVSSLGVYMTDPALNLNDPNNTASGLGGALVLDLDLFLAGGTGVLSPQTDTSAASFAGNYAVGWQDFNYYSLCFDCEFDMIAQGSVASGTLNLTGFVSDPFLTLGTPHTTSSGDAFSGTAIADGANPGRYTLGLNATIDGVFGGLDQVMYQASGGQLYWLGYDSNDFGVSSGPLEQQGSLNGLPAAKNRVPTMPTKRKR